MAYAFILFKFDYLNKYILNFLLGGAPMGQKLLYVIVPAVACEYMKLLILPLNMYEMLI